MDFINKLFVVAIKYKITDNIKSLIPLTTTCLSAAELSVAENLVCNCNYRLAKQLIGFC